MAYPTYPDELPCPTQGPLRPVERRDLTKLAGPREASPYQFAGQHQQRLTFRLTFEKAALWEQWWREVLIRGGAWFMAEWPHPTGEAVPRRFLGAPAWSVLKGVGWEVAVEAEVQSTDQLPVATEVPLWLDNFNGAAAMLHQHDQDIPLNGSVWFSIEGISASIDGAGYAEANEQSSYATTEFADDEGNPPVLGPVWRFEMEVLPIVFGGTPTGITIYSANGNDFSVTVSSSVDEVSVQVSVSFLDGTYTDLTLPAGAKRIIVYCTETGFTVSVNGDVFDEVASNTALSPTATDLFLPTDGLENTLNEVRGRIGRVALYGTILPPAPLVPGGILAEFDSDVPGLDDGFNVEPPECFVALDAPFNTEFNIDGEIVCTDDAGRMGCQLTDAFITATCDAMVTGRTTGGNFYGGPWCGVSLLVYYSGIEYVAELVLDEPIASFPLPPEIDFAVDTEVRITFDGSTATLFIDGVEVDSMAASATINVEPSQFRVEIAGDSVISKASITYLPT